MPTMVNAPESTANVNTSQHVREVDNRLHYLNPTAAPFTLLSKKATAKKVDLFKYEWGEKDRAPKYDQAVGAQTAGDTTIEVDNGGFFNVHDIVKNPRTGENFRVTAIVANSLTVVRGVGSTAAAAMNDNDDLFIIGSANPEGGALPPEKSHQEVLKHNFVQLFRTPFGATETQTASRAYWGPNRPRQRKEKSMEHLIDLESAFLFGERNEDTSNVNQPRRYTGGFLYWATDNVKDAGGILTEAEVWDWCEDLFAETGGSDRRVLFASAPVITALDLMGAGRIQLVPENKTYGISVKQWMTSHGTLLIVKHRLLVNYTGGNGYGGYALAVEPSQIGAGYLRDTKLLPNRQNPGDDKWADEYLSELGFFLRLSKLHGVLKNVTG